MYGFYLKKTQNWFVKKPILCSETVAPGIKSKLFPYTCWIRKIFFKRQISRTVMTQPNQQLALFRTSTDALKKINSRASQVQRPETNNLCKSQTDKSKLLFCKVWQTCIYSHMCNNISSDTTLPRSLSSHFLLQARNLEISVQAKRWNFGLTATCWSQILGTWRVI